MGDSQLTMLWQFQVNSEGTQPRAYLQIQSHSEILGGGGGVRASTYVFWGEQNSLMIEDKQLSLSYCWWQIPFHLFLRLCFFHPYYMDSPLPLQISKRHSFSKKVYPKPAFPGILFLHLFSSSLSTSTEPCLSSQACVFITEDVYAWEYLD